MLASLHQQAGQKLKEFPRFASRLTHPLLFLVPTHAHTRQLREGDLRLRIMTIAIQSAEELGYGIDPHIEAS